MITTNNARHGVQIHKPEPAPDHARLIADQARVWAGFVLEHARMKPETVYRKALDSITFSLGVNARALAVPSKLASTSHYQEALITLTETRPLQYHRLDTTAGADGIAVAFAGMDLGRIQDKHVPWLRPLLTCGATVHLLAVTGSERAEGFLGCNVALAHVGAAIARLRSVGGDGAAGPVDIVEDVRLWRDDQGRPCTNVPHVVRHAPTGIAWGYGGSGPADLALSILRRFTDADTADQLYQRFKHDVIATVPPEGGSIRAAFVISWVAAHSA